MALQVWLPLNGTLENKGLSNVTVTGQGTVAYDNNGKIGKCFISGGTSLNTNGISLNNNFLSIFNTTKGCSVAAWIKPVGTHVHYNGTIISSGNWNGSCWAFGVSLDNTKVDVFSRSYNRWIDCSIPVNQWTHLACVFLNGTSKVYKNGEYVGELGGFNNFISDASNTCIGRETYANGYFGFNGRINDVRIYDHALSAKEVKEISKGLILHYKLDDPYIEGTTNIVRYPTPGSAVGAVGWDQSLHQNAINVSNWSNGYNSGVDTPNKGYHACWKIIDNIPTMYMNDRNSTYVSSHRWLGIYGGISGTMIPSNTIYTVSFDAKSDVSNKQMSSGVYYRQSSSGSYAFHDGCPTFTLSTEWKRYSYTYTIKTVDNINSIYFYGHTGSIEGTVFIRNIQVELKNHATPYVGTNGTRDDSIIYDSSGYCNHGSITGTLTTNSDSPRYTKSVLFDGIKSCIRIPYNSICPSNIFTFNVWFKKNALGSKSFESLFGGPSGFEMDTRSNNSSTLSLYMASTRGGNLFSPFSLNTWYMVTMVRDGTNEYYYVNGELKNTIAAKPMPTGNYFIGAWNSATQQNYYGLMSDVRLYAAVLSADDIKELYNTSAFLTNSGTLYGYELKETTNSLINKTGVIETEDFIESELTTELMKIFDSEIQANIFNEI